MTIYTKSYECMNRDILQKLFRLYYYDYIYYRPTFVNLQLVKFSSAYEFIVSDILQQHKQTYNY